MAHVTPPDLEIRVEKVPHDVSSKGGILSAAQVCLQCTMDDDVNDDIQSRLLLPAIAPVIRPPHLELTQREDERI